MTSRLTTIVAALAAAVAVLGGVAAVAHGGEGGRSDELVITAEVQRRTLTEELTLQGTIGRVEQRRVEASSAAVVGTVHVEDGATVEAGQALLSLDGRDAVAVPGDLQFYRPLDVGARGADVRQLERVLDAAGHHPGTVDDLYTEQTRFALAQWQASHGYPGATPEASESVTVSLGQGTGYTVGSRSAAGVTIGAGLPPRTAPVRPAAATGGATFELASTANPLFTIRSVHAVTNEGNVAAFEISADDVPSGNREVNLVVSGSATGDDIVAPLGRVPYPSGAWSITVNIPTRQDDLVEPDETLTVGIATGTDYQAGTATATTRIVSDDMPELSLTGGGPVAEGATATLTLVADQAPVRDTQVALATSGEATASRDHRPLPALVTLPAGTTTVAVPVETLTDTVLEPDERLVVAIGQGTGYRAGRAGAAVVTISAQAGDAGLPLVTLRTTASDVLEGQPVPVVVSLDHSLTDDLPIRLVYGGTALLDGDYTPLGGRVVIPAGTTTATLQVATVQDGVVEPDRVLTVALAASDGYRIGTPSSATATIESDDLPELSLVGGGSVIEGQAATVRIVADQPPAEDTSVSYQLVGSASQGQDYAALTGTAVLRAGQTTLAIPLLTLADDVVFRPTDMIVGSWPIRVGEVLVDEGAGVQPGTPLLSLTEAGMTVTLRASAADRTKLEVGQQVSVDVDGAGLVPGVIASLDETATTDPQTQAQTYEGTVEIGDVAAADGAAVSIDVVLDQRDDALTVPIAAVKQDGEGNDVVRVLDLGRGGEVREVRVETGIAEGSYLEVRSGVEAGEVVIVQVDTRS